MHCAMELAFIKAGFVPGGTELSHDRSSGGLAVWQLRVLAHDTKHPPGPLQPLPTFSLEGK